MEIPKVCLLFEFNNPNLLSACVTSFMSSPLILNIYMSRFHLKKINSLQFQLESMRTDIRMFVNNLKKSRAVKLMHRNGTAFRDSYSYHYDRCNVGMFSNPYKNKMQNR